MKGACSSEQEFGVRKKRSGFVRQRPAPLGAVSARLCVCTCVRLTRIYAFTHGRPATLPTLPFLCPSTARPS